jgi:hypothetical protein
VGALKSNSVFGLISAPVTLVKKFLFPPAASPARYAAAADLSDALPPSL